MPLCQNIFHFVVTTEQVISNMERSSTNTNMILLILNVVEPIYQEISQRPPPQNHATKNE